MIHREVNLTGEVDASLGTKVRCHLMEDTVKSSPEISGNEDEMSVIVGQPEDVKRYASGSTYAREELMRPRRGSTVSWLTRACAAETSRETRSRSSSAVWSSCSLPRSVIA